MQSQTEEPRQGERNPFNVLHDDLANYRQNLHNLSSFVFVGVATVNQRVREHHYLDQAVIPAFQNAMAGEYWKFRMPVSLYEAGHFQDRFWKSRFILWCSAIDAIFTSQTRDREHSGSRVAIARIKWFLGAATKIYAPGDVPTFAPQPEPTVADVVDDLYEVRNCIAHGDKVPDRFFSQTMRWGESGNLLAALEEAASFIVRTRLLKILKSNLLNHFKGGPESQAYFQSNGLTRSQLP